MRPRPELEGGPLVGVDLTLVAGLALRTRSVSEAEAVPAVVVAGGGRVGTRRVELDAEAREVAAPPGLRQVLVPVLGVPDDGEAIVAVVLEPPVRRGPRGGRLEGAVAGHHVVVEVAARGGIGRPVRGKDRPEPRPRRTVVVLRQAADLDPPAGDGDDLLADVAARDDVARHGVLRVGDQVPVGRPEKAHPHDVAEGRVRGVHAEDPLNEDVGRLQRQVGRRGEVQHPLDVEAGRQAERRSVGGVHHGAHAARDLDLVTFGSGGEEVRQGAAVVWRGGRAVGGREGGVAREGAEHHVVHRQDALSITCNCVSVEEWKA